MYIKNFKEMNYLILTIANLIFLSGCNSGETESKVVPVNLQINIALFGANASNPNGDGSGKLMVTASAKNAVRYAFRFDNAEVQESQSGSMEHTFTKEGIQTYNVVAWAYSETGDFISETLTVDVFKSNESFTSLVFSDEFDYDGGLDEDKWFYQIIPPNNGSWFNNELQHYTDKGDNSFVSDGTLKIKAIKENYTVGESTKSYTSARLNSKFVFKYGRVEVRAKLPSKPGTWPAIWTLGANINEVGNYFGDQYGSVGWPDCGEIDIMEQKGGDKSKTLGVLHWGDTNTGEYKTQLGEINSTNASEEFHLYGLEWNEATIKITVDDNVVINISNTQDKPFDNLHYLILNLAMGGNLGGDVLPDFSNDIFEIDYVRIYQ
jgi:beta-glucanase (GH16 family)